MVTAGNNSTAAAPANGWSTHTISVPTAGAYKVWGRRIAPTTNDDSFWIRANSGTWVNWDTTEGTTWAWDDLNTAGTLTLNAGSNTITLAYRDDGTKMDMVLVTNDTAFTPSGTGPTPTPTPTPTPAVTPTPTPTPTPTFTPTPTNTPTPTPTETPTPTPTETPDPSWTPTPTPTETPTPEPTATPTNTPTPTPTPTPTNTPTPTPTPTNTPTPTPTNTPTPTPAFTYVWIEGESGTRTAPMSTFSDATASGGKYLMVTAGNNSTAAAPATGWSTHTFTVSTAGAYKVWGRRIAPTTADDSYWIRANGGTWVNWDITEGTTWAWDDMNTAQTFTLTAGSNTITLAYRDDGTKMDKMLITNDTAYTPTGLGN
jgi:hypothetical protein